MKAPKRSKSGRARGERKSLDSISSISSSSLSRSRSRSPTKRYNRKKSRSRSRSVSLVRVYRKSQSPSFKKYPVREFPRKVPEKQPIAEKRQLLPTPKELSAQASEIGAERYKWEKYR